MLGPHIPSHVPTSAVSSQSTSVGVLGAHPVRAPGSALICAPVRAWRSHTPQPCSSRRLSCKGFLVLLQHVSPKSDFTIPVVSFLNVCKGKRRNAVQSPLSNATTQQAAVPGDTPSECSCQRQWGPRLCLSCPPGTPPYFTAIKTTTNIGSQAISIELQRTTATTVGS